MKKVFKPFMMMATVAGILAVSSCTKTCDEGYEGSDCKTEVRAKFLGNYHGTEQCTAGNDEYNVVIAASSTDVVKVTISNVYNQGFTATASVSGSSLTIESQTVVSGVVVSGTGSVSGDGKNLTLTYSIGDGTTNNSCTFTGEKQ